MSSKFRLSELFDGNGWAGRHILGIEDLTAADVRHALHCAHVLREHYASPGGPDEQLLLARHKRIGLIFEKPSLRTRVSFEGAAAELGAGWHWIEYNLDNGREPLRDIAGCLSQYCAAIVVRTFSHRTLQDLAQWSRVPVINALDDREHPCQALADYMAIKDHVGRVAGVRLAYLGDAGSNVFHSLMLTGAMLGSHISIACPAKYEPDPELLDRALREAEASGGSITITDSTVKAIRGADVVCTDTHVSMGQEHGREERRRKLRDYMVTAELMQQAGPNAKFIHCLPAHRGEEVEAAVIDGPQSIILPEARCRLLVQKALLALVLQPKR